MNNKKNNGFSLLGRINHKDTPLLIKVSFILAFTTLMYFITSSVGIVLTIFYTADNYMQSIFALIIMLLLDFFPSFNAFIFLKNKPRVSHISLIVAMFIGANFTSARYLKYFPITQIDELVMNSLHLLPIPLFYMFFFYLIFNKKAWSFFRKNEYKEI